MKTPATLLFAALGIIAGAAPGETAAAEGYTLKNVHLRAGPARDYPVVAILPAQFIVDIIGCIEDYKWCDVQAGANRGWVYAGNIGYAYNGAEVRVVDYGTVLGLGILAFGIHSYWDDYYRDRYWYYQKPNWQYRYPSHYHNHYHYPSHRYDDHRYRDNRYDDHRYRDNRHDGNRHNDHRDDNRYRDNRHDDNRNHGDGHNGSRKPDENRNRDGRKDERRNPDNRNNNGQGGRGTGGGTPYGKPVTGGTGAEGWKPQAPTSSPTYPYSGRGTGGSNNLNKPATGGGGMEGQRPQKPTQSPARTNSQSHRQSQGAVMTPKTSHEPAKSSGDKNTGHGKHKP